MLLVIDIGNTRIKWGIFDGKELLQNGACAHADFVPSNLLASAKKCQQAIIGHVASATILKQVIDFFDKNGLRYSIVTSSGQTCGVVNGYKMPKTLGVDRWASVIAAYHQTKQSALVVNAGTAITIDALEVVGGQAKFIGGSIMPGLALMQTALQNQTANLQQPIGSLQALPTQTDDAIASGLLNAVVGAIVLASQNLSLRALSPTVILLTGGDALQLQDALKFYGISADIAENLVLHGLNLLGLDLLESESA